jgi:hypothetical protein
MVSSSAFMLGVIGGLLDFASATSLLVDRATQSGMMGIGASYVAAALGLYVLGVLVIVTSLFSAMLVGMRHPSLFSVLMIVYGVAMVAAGWIMSTDMISTATSSLYSLGMIALGALMVVNALLMSRSRVEV